MMGGLHLVEVVVVASSQNVVLNLQEVVQEG